MTRDEDPVFVARRQAAAQQVLAAERARKLAARRLERAIAEYEELTGERPELEREGTGA